MTDREENEKIAEKILWEPQNQRSATWAISGVVGALNAKDTQLDALRRELEAFQSTPFYQYQIELQEEIRKLRQELEQTKEENNKLLITLKQVQNYSNAFGAAMNDYHQAYLREARKVNTLRQEIEHIKKNCPVCKGSGILSGLGLCSLCNGTGSLIKENNE